MLLIKNIRQLVQVRDEYVEIVKGADMAHLPVIENAWLLIENDTIANYGTMDSCPELSCETLDATGRLVLPAWCDSHTHLVYAGNRHSEYVDRISGLTYEEIARRGGGILNSAQRLNETSEQDLFEQAAHRLDQVIRMGTGAIEIKSGYGLTLDGELKMLRVIKRLSEQYPVAVKATFLGAHAFPAAYKADQQAYIDSLIREMIPAVAANGLADYIDVFCETGYFSVEQSVQIMKAGIAHGLPPKIHVNQFTAIGGIRAAVDCNALSVDHLELITEDDILALQGSRTMPVALPGCSFFISIPYTPGRQIISAGLPLALATDYNPGTAPSGNMNFAVGAACAKMKLLPQEAINAATINAAYAMGLSATHGSITREKKANLMVTVPLPSYVAIPYEFANNPVHTMILNGKVYA